MIKKNISIDYKWFISFFDKKNFNLFKYYKCHNKIIRLYDNIIGQKLLLNLIFNLSSTKIKINSFK